MNELQQRAKTVGSILSILAIISAVSFGVLAFVQLCIVATLPEDSGDMATAIGFGLTAGYVFAAISAWACFSAVSLMLKLLAD